MRAVVEPYRYSHVGHCPSHKDGKCSGDWAPFLVPAKRNHASATCMSWWCTGCEQWRPWCHGSSDSLLCDTCEAQKESQ